jgi:hypothetical protein
MGVMKYGIAISYHTMQLGMVQVGLVFQFPERHFLGSDIYSELTFSWPRGPEYALQQQVLKARMVQVSWTPPGHSWLGCGCEGIG